MGWLRKLDSEIKCVVEAEHLVGRSPRAALRLSSNYVSAQHAMLRWVRDHWEIKDLGSRNGTVVEGTTLSPGRSIALSVGTKIAFGHSGETWELADASCPRPMLMPEGPGVPLELDGEIVAFPSAQDPQATIVCSRDGTCSIEQEDELRPLADGQYVVLSGDRWRFCCPQNITDTALVDWFRVDGVVLRDFSLCFTVSRDEEHVELALERDSEVISMGSRSHNYLLLTLARQRLAEAQDREAADAGWMYHDQLFSALKTDREHLNLDVFRIRKQFSAAGIQDAVRIVERRATTRQLRIGTPAISIRRG